MTSAAGDRDDEASEFRMAYCLECKRTHAFGFDGFSGAPLELPWCVEEIMEKCDG